MKNEPTFAYNHLQEEEEHSISSHSAAESQPNWKNWVNPVAIAIEILAIVAIGFFMIQEMF